MIGICNHFYIVSKVDWILLILMNCLLFIIIKDVRIFFYTFHLRCGKIRRDVATVYSFLLNYEQERGGTR